MSETESAYEQDYDSDSAPDERRYHKGGKSGKHVREEPINLREFHAFPLAMQCFEHHETRPIFITYQRGYPKGT